MSSEMIVRGEDVEVLDLVEIRLDAVRYPRVASLLYEDIAGTLQAAVARAFMYRGQQAQPENVAFVASALFAELRQGERTRNLSLTEVIYAIRKAALSRDTYGINVASLFAGCEDYCTGEGARAHAEAANRKRQAEFDAERARLQQVRPMVMAYTGAMINNLKTQKK